VITTQVALLTLIHGQPSCVVSVTLPAPPLRTFIIGTGRSVGSPPP